MIAMPVVKVKARTIATNIFFIDLLRFTSPYSAGLSKSDIMLNIRMLFLRENT